jgi:hypothetical protein
MRLLVSILQLTGLLGFRKSTFYSYRSFLDFVYCFRHTPVLLLIMRVENFMSFALECLHLSFKLSFHLATNAYFEQRTY